MTWFSTCVRLMCLIEGDGSVRYQDSVFLLAARDWSEARSKALRLGHSKEEVYSNSEGNAVRWAFERLVTLDEIGEPVDGIEVYSQPIELGQQTIPFDQRFAPETIEPTQSV